MGKPVVHWEITARDPRRLEQFYSSMFDWQIDAAPVSYRRVDTGSPSGIQGGLAETDGSWPSGALFYVEVDDVRDSLRRAEELGASTLLPPTDLPDASRIAIFRDPEGVRVGIMERASTNGTHAAADVVAMDARVDSRVVAR